MSVLDNARAAADALEAEWRGAEHEAGPEFAAVNALRDLIAEYERVTAPPTAAEREALISALVMTRLSDYAGTDMVAITQASDTILAAGFRRRGPITDEMVAAALDARAVMPSKHCYLYATERCRCGEEWSDAHWMRFILEAALGVA